MSFLHKMDVNYLFGDVADSQELSDPGVVEDPKSVFINWMTSIERKLSSMEKQLTDIAVQSSK